MHSKLFSIGPFTVHVYGLMMAAGFVACWSLASRLCARIGVKGEDVSNLLTLMMVSGIVGARAAYVIEHWSSEFAADPLQIVRVDQGGLMFYGGLILAVIVFFIHSITRRMPISKTADLFTALIPLGHAFGRVGCFFHGCCYGRRSDVFGVTFPTHSPAWCEQIRDGLITPEATRSLPVIPVQLVEAAGCLALAAALVAFFMRRYPSSDPSADVKGGAVAGAYLVGYAILRFALEFLRGDSRASVGPLSIGQTISLALVGLGIAFFLHSRAGRDPGRISR